MKLALSLALLVLTGTAAAADQPGAYGMAQRGSFKLVAGVLLSDRGGEMKAAWLDAKQACRVRRTLRVAIQIDLVNPNGTTTRVKRSRRGAVDGCAEGGPSFGYDLVPHALGLGCSAGRWKPGRYSMITRVSDQRSGLVAQASLYRQVTRRC